MSYEEDEEFELSRTQKRKLALEVLTFTKKLAARPLKELEKLDLHELVKEELLKVHRMKSTGAKTRQIKYVAGLIRSLIFSTKLS